MPWHWKSLDPSARVLGAKRTPENEAAVEQRWCGLVRVDNLPGCQHGETFATRVNVIQPANPLQRDSHVAKCDHEVFDLGGTNGTEHGSSVENR